MTPGTAEFARLERELFEANARARARREISAPAQELIAAVIAAQREVDRDIWDVKNRWKRRRHSSETGSCR